MKIGQVSKTYDISIDTLNYYVNYGLLVPAKKGGQRDFDSRTLQDLEWLIELKNLRFSLAEIHRIISLKRISNFASREDIDELIFLYTTKRTACLEESGQLVQTAQKLEEKIGELNCAKLSSASKIGLPARMLDLLCCPLCGADFEISDVQMNLRYLFSGHLSCGCGYRAEIENGILLTPNKNQDQYDQPDVDRDMYKDLPAHLITLFQEAYNWMIEQLDTIQTGDKVVLETYVNAWFFLHNHQQYLDPKGRYIVVDKYPETLAAYKQIIEKQNRGLDILYIADSSTRLPLKPRCVDVNIDFFAVNEHNFYHQSFLPDRLRPYFAPGADMVGTYFYFKNGYASMRTLLREYPTCAAHNFSKEYFLKSMEKHGYHLALQKEIGYVTDAGKNIGFSFHHAGEQMHLLSYLAQTAK